MELLTAPELRQLLKISPNRFASLIRNPDFPRPIRLDHNDTKRRWRATDIAAWVASREPMELSDAREVYDENGVLRIQTGRF